MAANRPRLYRALGYTFGVAPSSPALDAPLRRCLRPFEAPGDISAKAAPLYELRSVGAAYVASLDGTELRRSSSPGSAFFELIWRVGYEAGRSVESLDLALHAGAVCIDGVGVVMPASSGSGKSTLVAALVASGAEYLTDEVACLRGGVIVPFPRPLGLKRGSLALLDGLEGRLDPTIYDAELPEYVVAPDDLRADSVGRATALSCVVFPKYEAGSPTVVEPVRRAAGVVELIRNTFNMRLLGPDALERLVTQTEGVTFHRLHSGDLGEAVAAVRSIAAVAARAVA